VIFLLVIIYLAFISLGLPDSLLGSAWPVMHADLNAPLSVAGGIAVIVCAGTVVSSLLSSRLIYRWGTGRVTLVSVLATAAALLGVSFSNSLVAICLLCVPLGLGAGAVDAALNNFVSLHYKAMHMNWLHCFWGVGATLGPIVMSHFIASGGRWQSGYFAISSFQFALALILLVTLPLWRKAGSIAQDPGAADVNHRVTNRQALKIKGVKLAMVAFLCYCGYEIGAGLWSASYLTEQRGLAPDAAAGWVALFYGGITFGRLISGFASAKLSSLRLIRLGGAINILGILFLLLPLPNAFCMFGLVLIGLGAAPFYPAMMHETPRRFGKANSQAAMGLQMASAYIGSTCIPPMIGLLSEFTTLAAMPWTLLAMALGALIFSERSERAATASSI
jgi:fucose permease